MLKKILPVIDVSFLGINTIDLNIAFKAVEIIRQDIRQKSWNKVTLIECTLLKIFKGTPDKFP